jgi:hypothetical protein
MYQNQVEPVRPQMTIRRMRIAYWIPEANSTHSEYVIFFEFSLQKYLHRRAYCYIFTYIESFVLFFRSETSDSTMAFLIMSIHVNDLVSTELVALTDSLLISYIIENTVLINCTIFCCTRDLTDETVMIQHFMNVNAKL